jgi:hypothetical protein
VDRVAVRGVCYRSHARLLLRLHGELAPASLRVASFAALPPKHLLAASPLEARAAHSANEAQMQFTPFPKMGRLTRECVITEKIDGTNAQVQIVSRCSCSSYATVGCSDCPRESLVIAERDGLLMFAGSRTRYITPTDDNFGFAAWVATNADALWALGPGQHFGEWWGSKIQRGYGLDERRFSLFNTARWSDPTVRPACCDVVPVLYSGLFGERHVSNMLAKLVNEGSQAAPGFMDPEGIVIYHTATGTMFKKTIKGDEVPKGRQAA